LTSNTGPFVELKSWKKSTIENIASHVKFKNQFLAYLQITEVTSMSKLNYSFDAWKLSKEFNTNAFFNDAAAAEMFIKEQFQTLYQQQATSLFNTLGATKFQNLFGVNNVQDFIDDVIPDLSSAAYSFIKVE